jgi:cysteine desulfurase
MTLDAQKVFAPNGTGALYVRRGVVLEPIILGGGQENSLRSGTESVALAEEFATALLRAQKNADSVAEKISEVRDFLFDEIKKLIPDAILNGPSSGYTRVASNLNVSIPGLDGQMAVIAMDALGVALSTRSACSVEDEAFSYILTAIGADRARAQSALRITLMPGTSKRDAINIARALARVVDLYRR